MSFRADMTFSNIDITSRPKANEFPILIKTRNRKIPFFLWRKEIKDSTLATWLGHDFDNVLRGSVLRIALKIGRMRSRFYIFMRSQTRISARLNPFRLIIDMSIIDQISTGVTHYLVYHVRNHPLFNKLFSAGYKDPTTDGTEPINRSEISRVVEKGGARQLVRDWHLRGLIL